MRTAAVMMAAAGIAMMPVAATAQDWKAALAAGQIGEQSDGYLGVVAGGGALSATVSAVNIQRKKAYSDAAAAQGATVEAMGIASGCNLIKRLPAGARYRTSGGWQTVGQGALQLDPRCP